MALLLFKSIKFPEIICNLFSEFIWVCHSWIRILPPDIENTHKDVLAKIQESPLGVQWRGRFILLRLIVIHGIIIQPHILPLMILLLLRHDHLPLIYFLPISIPPTLQPVHLALFHMLPQPIITGITVIPALQGIRVYHPKLLIQYHPATPLLIHLLKSILGFHVFPGEVTLLELEVYAVLAQEFREEVALDV